jgi:DNA primase
MGVSPEDISAVRSASDLVALVSERVALRRSGSRLVGLCPFHNENTPSFSVNGPDGRYYCFGCHASGDVVDYVRQIQQLGFQDAVEYLADRFGVTLSGKGTDSADRRRHHQMRDALVAAIDYYHSNLLDPALGEGARDYLADRGVGLDEIERFSLGLALGSFDGLCRAVKEPPSILVASGLAFRNRAGRTQDFLRNRVIFPIFDPQGQPVAVAGRLLPGSAESSTFSEPKYKNSPETELYRKKRVLYGLNWARSSIVASGLAVVCEGYTDVLACYRAGIANAVATCGTALGDEHLELLTRYSKRVVLAYDGDKAGVQAMERIYGAERRFDLELRVAQLPDGRDPAEVEPAELVRAVKEAEPLLGFKLRRTFSLYDLGQPEGRARAADAAVMLLSAHPSRAAQEAYVPIVASHCRLPEPSIQQMLASARQKGRGQEAPGPRSQAPGPRSQPDTPRPSVSPEAFRGPEAEALRHMIVDGARAKKLLNRQLFGSDLRRQAFDLLDARSETTSLSDLIASAPPELAGLLSRLSVEAPQSEVEEVACRLAAVRLADLGQQIGLALRAGTADLASASSATLAIKRLQADLGAAGPRLDALDGALALLLEWGEVGQ